MSHTAQDLLIIYEPEAEQWATYLQSVFTGVVSAQGICCYDISSLSGWRDDFLRLAGYTCKLLILSKGMLEALCQVRRFFLAHVLSPATHVVVLLCGVDNLTQFLELVPLDGSECLQISSEQDAHKYLSTVTDIVRKGASAAAANVNPLTRKSSGSEQKPEQIKSTTGHGVKSGIVVVPPRVLCGSSTRVFILLRKEAAGVNTEVEFTAGIEVIKVKPIHWGDRILCVDAPDFPAGSVNVTVFSDGVPLSKAQLSYYSNMEELIRLLSQVADPVDFMCQALQVSSADKLDQKLSSMLLKGMPTGGFQGLQIKGPPERAEVHHADMPTLLHFAARYGMKSISSLLLQCPGAEQAVHTANCHGQTPIEISKSHGHTELHILLKETLKMLNPGEDTSDASVYEMMCTAGKAPGTEVQREQRWEADDEDEEEDPYAPLRVADEYDTILTSTTAVAIANRPPAPTPRPETTPVKEDRTPYITKVFMKKKTQQGDTDLYSLPTKQAQGREDGMSSTYDTYVPDQIQWHQQLVELRQRVKTGSLTVEEALERLNDWQRVQKGMNTVQQEKLSQLRASIINNKEDDDSVYDKINIVRRTPSAVVNESQRGSQSVDSEFYSKPLKGHTGFFRKVDKR